jgi:hypothetical protein
MKLCINFEIGDALGRPGCKIVIDDYLVLHEGNALPRFEREFEISSGQHELKIVHFGKTDQDHVYNIDGSIGIDKYIQIDSITIDSVRLNDSELQEGQFWPVYSDSYMQTLKSKEKIPPLFICPNLYLGHNGTWKWDFHYPFVDWIIAKRRPGLNLDNTIFRSSAATLQRAKDFFSQVKDI